LGLHEAIPSAGSMRMKKKLGILVGERGLWKFFRGIYEDLAAHYETLVYEPKEYHLPILSGRLNGWTHQNVIRTILKRSDACFFEWASELLVTASHMPKYSPIIARLHSFELAEWAERINWDRVDKIIFISEAMRCKFAARFPTQTRKTMVVYNSIDLDKFRPTQRTFDFSLGMLGTILPIKRIYEAILVVKELREQGFSPSLHIAGGPDHDNLNERYYVAVHRLVERLELNESVHFYGNVDDAASWLQNIDIFISNSYWEGMQTALLEAMASGCYCLAHFWDGAEEALPAENIYSSDSDLRGKMADYAQLSDADRTARRHQMIEIAHRKFDIEDKKVRIREIIDSVV
jgi:glycosyltransferase involved in cell wall biosynthesis